MLSPDLARIRSFEVVPSLPEPLKPLLDIAYNLWWSWHPEAVELFIRLDRNLWHETHHNPVKLLGMVPQQTLDTFSRDEGYISSLARVQENLQRHMTRTPWLQSTEHRDAKDFTIAYFCAEFGLTECLQVYSGGLGCLAGDHLKSAAELGLPFVAVGLLYRNGYFQQYLNADGWQQEYYPELDLANLPLRPVSDSKGNQVKVTVDLPGRVVHIGLWLVKVGRIPLYLLDTNLPENEEDDRGITSQLYGGDMETRIKQEIVLGIGGVRALEAINIRPDVCHMNEGHSAFLALERVRRLIEEHDLSFDEARQAGAASNVFTTHTPVPAGIDRFPPDMVDRYFRSYVPGLRLDMEGLFALGRENVFNKHEFFSMAVLAIRTSSWANGVSKLHGKISRHMWQGIWPQVPESEIPIKHVTNGVHARSWLSSELMYLLDRYLGARWQNNPADQSVWKAVMEMPEEELWRLHERRRQKLVIWARRRLRKQFEARNINPDHIAAAADALDPMALTIGFARRFATYKRGNLFLRDPDRLMRLLSDADRPVQFIFAGKAHPADGGGKELIRQIVKFARESDAGHKIVFLENYDINVARYLVQGCDLWLNTPRRGMEASGTSGMKAAMNGVLNCSIMDGWWDEAAEPDLGWSIGRGEEYSNPAAADDLESRAFYDLLEQEIVPLFYNRDSQGIPRQWVTRMKKCIASLAPGFNTNRMVQEYAEKLYLPALRRGRDLTADKLKKSVELAHQKVRLRGAWGKLRVDMVQAKTEQAMGVRDALPVTATVYLGELQPDEVKVQAYTGPLDTAGRIVGGKPVTLKHDKSLGKGKHRFTGEINAINSGRYGFAIRIVPGDEIFDITPEPGLIHWEGVKSKPAAAEAVVAEAEQAAT
ncbi:alpha-glucan family phosphorylase [Phycisphaerales bacterium AB-hyl4]|uniref:glycogen phosphorylase n=1 Tax=Natronomicrosphaera hydrolytica TaxID=3242702 RepID=A0ABV4U626_9BACT